MPKRFCAICGKDIDETAPHFSMCLDCYLKENPLFILPDHFNLKICNYCGKFTKKDTWIPSNSYETLEIIEEAIQILLLNQIKNAQSMRFKIIPIEESTIYSSNGLLISVDLKVLGELIEDHHIYNEQKITVKVNNELCKNCANLRGGTFFTSILQLRLDGDRLKFLESVINDLTNLVEKLFEKDEKQYISNIVKQKNGFDLYLSTNELLNHIISYMKANYRFGLKRTKKLVGRDHQRGKNIYRLKAVMRFLPFNKGDYININDESYYVEQIKKKSVILRDNLERRIIKNYDFFFNEKISLKKVENG
jgi:NMD protein affecting ribosome stability and mRNA decay